MKTLLRFYRQIISPAHHFFGRTIFGTSYACRYSPTCSVYFSQAVHRYGIICGGWLGLKRLLRCHPYSHTPHFDPLPKY